MNINWKVRFKNKVWLTTFITFVISSVYSLLDMLGVIPSVPQDKVLDIAMTILQLLSFFGIVVDPTTANGFMDMGDSKRALAYEEPRKDEVEA